MGETKRGPGRPRIRIDDDAGDYVGFRASKSLKEKLASAAKESGRSMSTEAQIRLENSFRDEAMAISVLELAFGRWLPQILQVLSETHTDGKTTVQ